MTRTPTEEVALTTWSMGTTWFAGAPVFGDGDHLVTIAPSDGALLGARALPEIGAAPLGLQPIVVAPSGALILDGGFSGSELKLSFATFEPEPIP